MRGKIKLNEKHCLPCDGIGGAMPVAKAKLWMAELHPDWKLEAKGTAIRRKFLFKGFAKPVYHANLAAWLADQEGHHPDIAFGWGYCDILFTTHAVEGLSENDFICAAKLDRLVAEKDDPAVKIASGGGAATG